MDGVFFSRPIGFERSPTIEAKAHKPWVKTKRGRMLFRPRHDEPWTINATASSPVRENVYGFVSRCFLVSTQAKAVSATAENIGYS